ncbi:C-terminal helicase domain-containing protein, partial [Rhodobacteraceae bacterium]|nr:C-terminal helicase domain-containing protein [Paracoccaceae bacterium]
FLSNPARIEVARQATASEMITQEVIMVQPSRRDRAAKEKRDVLRAVIEREAEKCTNAIIFCNRKSDVDIVAKSLKKYGLDAAPIHGDLDQSQRTKTLDAFRDGSLRFLVASDVAARGLDVPAVSHVFNYDVPTHSEDYVHRIGRTGRAGREGKAIMISAPSDSKNLDAIEKLLAKEIPRSDNPVAGAPQSEPVAATRDEVEKPKRSRSRRSRSDASKSDAPNSGAPKVVEQVEKKADAPQTGATETDAAPATPNKPEDDNKQRNRGGRGRRDGGGNKFMGMGDDMPSFIAKSFEERKVS